LTVVAYDITDDRRRARLASALEDYGVRVQYSVFECMLTRERLSALRREVERIVDPDVDRVDYYQLCTRCDPVREGRRADAPSLVV
jgi:CRISPR-associated protein Cas2